MPKQPGRQTIVVKKTSTAISKGRAKEDGATLRRYIAEYMDETIKNENGGTMLRYKYEGAKLKHGVAQRTASHPGLRAGVDYLTKEPRGEIGVHGFLRRLVEAKTGRQIGTLTNIEKAESVEEIWKIKLAEKGLKKIAHKFVFSLDPEIAKKMREKGIPVDEHLNRIVRETWRRYQDKFYPGQEIGYLDGIHHDRAHPHSHVLLYPQTAQGKPLNVSRATEKPNLNISGRPFRIDYQDFITRTAFELGQELEVMVMYTAPKIPGANIDCSQERLLSQAAWDDTKATGIAKSDPTFKPAFLARRRELDLAQDDHVRKVLATQYARQAANYRDSSPSSAMRNIDLVEAGRLEWRRELKAQASLRPDRPASMGDIAKARGILMGWQWIQWDGTEGRWWTARAKSNDDLGRWLHRTREELDSAFAQYDRETPFTGGRLNYQSKRARVDRHLMELEALRIQSQAQAQAVRKAYRAAKQARLDEVAITRYVGHVMSRTKSDAKAVLNRTKPNYLLHYEGWQARKAEVPLYLPSRAMNPAISEMAKVEQRRTAVAFTRPITPEEVTEAKPRLQDNHDENSPDVLIPPSLSGPASLQPVIDLEGPKAALAKIEAPVPDQDALDDLEISL